MNSVLVILVLCVAGALSVQLTAEQKALLQPLADVCLAENGLTTVELDEILADMENVRSEILRQASCFSACMFKKIGFMTESGEIDEEVTKAIMSENVSMEKINQAFDNCRGLTGKDDCEYAANMAVCFGKNDIAVE